MYGCSVWCSQGKGRFTDLCAPVSLLADRSSSVINDLSSYQITVYIQRVNKAFCIFNYYVQYLCNYGCSLLQFWSMIVCTQASIGSSLRNYIPLLSSVHLDSPGQKPYCLFFIRVSPGKWYNGMHSSRTILSVLDFLNHFILVKCKYLCTKSCLYHLLLAVLLLKSKGKYCYLFMQLLL